MNWKKRVRREISIGVLIGAVCLTAVLYFLLKTEERAQEHYYLGVVPDSEISLLGRR